VLGALLGIDDRGADTRRPSELPPLGELVQDLLGQREVRAEGRVLAVVEHVVPQQSPRVESLHHVRPVHEQGVVADRDLPAGVLEVAGAAHGHPVEVASPGEVGAGLLEPIARRQQAAEAEMGLREFRVASQ